MLKLCANSNRRILTWLAIAFLSTTALAGCGLLGDDRLTISWTTESELDVVGFNLYRSESPDGPFVKINDELIPPAEDPFVGGEHTYVDQDVENGTTYYYQLETVDRLGNTTRTDSIAITAG